MYTTADCTALHCCCPDTSYQLLMGVAPKLSNLVPHVLARQDCQLEDAVLAEDKPMQREEGGTMDYIKLAGIFLLGLFTGVVIDDLILLLQEKVN